MIKKETLNISKDGILKDARHNSTIMNIPSIIDRARTTVYFSVILKKSQTDNYSIKRNTRGKNLTVKSDILEKPIKDALS